MHHSIWNFCFVLGAYEYLERQEGKIRKCLLFYVKIFLNNNVWSLYLETSLCSITSYLYQLRWPWIVFRVHYFAVLILSTLNSIFKCSHPCMNAFIGCTYFDPESSYDFHLFRLGGYLLPTLTCLIKGHARLFISEQNFTLPIF